LVKESVGTIIVVFQVRECFYIGVLQGPTKLTYGELVLTHRYLDWISAAVPLKIEILRDIAIVKGSEMWPIAPAPTETTLKTGEACCYTSSVYA